ncbi:AhpC/Tsa family protein GSU0066 [hydrothermal vent metagenome]|uniref:thioredoxin-dependent peroxiredoxin n=1 Tax=hydrothermal vent metagenome TaxID=652676 RepID=A0A3B1ANT2_9ZZZZ
MTLNEQIRDTIQQFRDTLPPELAALIEQGAGEISALEIVENALRVGDSAPDFALATYNGESRTLESYLAQGPLVLTFYRGAWCPYCNLQLAAYNARLDEIRETGANLVAITPEQAEGADVFLDSDAPPSAKDSIVRAPNFDVLHDNANQLARKYGLVFTLPQAHAKLFELMNFEIEKATGDSSYTFPDPATYIIDVDGIIYWAFVPNNYRKRAEPDEIIKQLNTLKTHQEVSA